MLGLERDGRMLLGHWSLTVLLLLVDDLVSFMTGQGVVDANLLGDVGVAGLTLGGGLSFLSGQYGLVCDNVVNYEIVLADASIVNANATSDADLFFALKGGGNQFGESLSLSS